MLGWDLTPFLENYILYITGNSRRACDGKQIGSAGPS